MKKSIRLMAVLVFAALTLCSCGKNEKSKTSGNKNNTEISTTVPNDVYVVAPDVIYYDEDGNIIESTVSATDSQYIEINPFEGWDLNQFTRELKGNITGEYFNNFCNSDVYKTLNKKGLHPRVDMFTVSGENCKYFDLPEYETVIAKIGTHVFDEFYDGDDDGDGIIYDDELVAYAKEKGIILTETSKEVIVNVTNGLKEPLEVSPFDILDIEFGEDFSGNHYAGGDLVSFRYEQSEIYYILKANDIFSTIKLYSVDGTELNERDISLDNKTVIAKIEFNITDEDGTERFITDDEAIEYAKNDGIILTEVTKEIVIEEAME